MFITFEAGEGAGKSTQAGLLKARLDNLSIPSILTREPGGSSLAEDLRNFVVSGDPDRMDAMTELLIFTAARRDHVEKIVKPALREGKVVICDRYIGSTYALQGAAGISESTISRIHSAAGVTLVPDITIYLDAGKTLDRGLQRLADDGSDENRFERKGISFHASVDACFKRMAAQNPSWVTVNGKGDITDVSERIWRVLSSHDAFPKCHANA